VDARRAAGPSSAATFLLSGARDADLGGRDAAAEVSRIDRRSAVAQIPVVAERMGLVRRWMLIDPVASLETESINGGLCFRRAGGPLGVVRCTNYQSSLLPKTVV
jgi:hypothetical protein